MQGVVLCMQLSLASYSYYIHVMKLAIFIGSTVLLQIINSYWSIEHTHTA